MTLDEAIEIICKDYCKYPDTESGNKNVKNCDGQTARPIRRVSDD